MKENKSQFSKDDLKKILTPLQYKVTQEKATEKPYTGEYDKFFETGKYNCIVCGTTLFRSDQKFDSGCGWPAFSDHNGDNVKFIDDSSYGMKRTETVCKICGAHLGHIFKGEKISVTDLRYCINSASLKFEK